MTFRPLAGALAMLVLVSAGDAYAAASRFDLRCHYVKVYGHESFGGDQIPYRGPRVRSEHLAIDLSGMTFRELNHGIVATPGPIPRVSKSRIWLEDTPYLKMIIDRSTGRFVETRIENDDSQMLFEGRCRFDRFTPPDPPGQPYQGR